jgi:hypothetical protein
MNVCAKNSFLISFNKEKKGEEVFFNVANLSRKLL